MMVKSDLIEALHAENPNLALGHIKRTVDLFFENISHALIAGRRVELRDFGAFSVRAYGPHSGRNPRTGAKVEVTAKNRVHFKPGKKMRERLMNRAMHIDLEGVD